MKIRKKICIIVDGYSTGSSLAKVFAAYGYGSIHIQSSAKIASNLEKSFRVNDYIDNIIYSGDIDSVCASINAKGFEIICIIPGCEPGVELADILSERFNCSTSNGTLYSRARRNKFLMTEAVKKAGIPTVNYIKSNNIEEILKYISNYNQFSSPIVLKPLESSCTDGFHICRTEKEVRDAFSKLHLSKNVFNAINDEILVQNFLEGQEYCVNTVSLNGIHYVCEIWQINKSLAQHSKIYNCMKLIDDDIPEYQLLKQYTESVLNALHIKNGPAHTEIIIDKNNQPILLETAARLMGAFDLSLITQALNSNATLITVEAYLTSDIFLKRINQPKQKIKAYPYMIHLISEHEGILQEYCLENLRKLKTFYGIDTYLEPGSIVRKTVDSITSPGVVFLISENKDDLERDYSLLRKMEQSGEIYKILPPAPINSTDAKQYQINELPTIFREKKAVSEANNTESYSEHLVVGNKPY